MFRQFLIFGVCFLAGSLLTLVLRTIRHDPHAQVTPSAVEVTTAVKPPVAAVPVPVNTLCALCGMQVDTTIPTAVYRGQVIGFGCTACPARFAADPERYGPAALANQVVE